jgi:hypothetical protein
MSQEQIFAATQQERRRQDIKWGPKPPLGRWPWPQVLMEEVGELMEADLEHDREHFIEESIHAIAVLFAMVETSGEESDADH